MQKQEKKEETKLYIDDLRDPPSKDFVVVRSYADAINYMRTNGCPDYISFDHDLGLVNINVELSGYDIAKWIVECDMKSNGSFIPENFTYTVHSANPIGAANIIGLLGSYLKQR